MADVTEETPPTILHHNRKQTNKLFDVNSWEISDSIFPQSGKRVSFVKTQ